MPSFCSVYKCAMRRQRDQVSFFRMPAVLTKRGDYLVNLSVQRRDAWISALKRGPLSESQLKTWRVCSRHFIEGKPSYLEDYMHPDWIPNQNMGYTTARKLDESAASRYERFGRRRKKEHLTTKVYAPVPRTSLNQVTRVKERTAMPTVIASTINTENSDTFIINSKKTTMEKRKVHKYSSDRPSILHRTRTGSKVAKLISHQDDFTNAPILKDIKTQNANIETECVDIKMEPQDNTYNSVEEPATVLHEKPSDGLILVDSSEYHDLFNENKLLKKLLTKTGISSNIESSGDNLTSTELSHLIDLTDIHRICRVCLKLSDNLVSMNEKLMFENKNILEMTVLESIQSIVGDRVDIDDNFPRQICSQCQNHLKLFITFKYTFNRTSSILSYINEPLENNERQYISDSVSKDHDYTKQNILEDEVCCKVELEEHEIDNSTENVDILQVRSEDLPKLVDTIPSKTHRNLSQTETKKRKMKLHTCPICWIKVSISKLIPHVKSHNTLEKYLNIPKVSPKTRFYAPARDVIGLMSGDSEKLHKCPICSKEFKAAEYILHVHHNLTHDQFKCEECDRTFEKKSYLLHHMLIKHSKSFPYRCEKCNRGFVIKSTYDCHLLTHEGGELPHKCVDCSKSFSNPKSLSRHMTIHTGNRTYSTKLRPKRHMMKLRKVPVMKSYICSYCRKPLTSSYNLKVHERIHIGNKCHVCPICAKGFLKKSYLNKHVKMHKEVDVDATRISK